MIRDENILFYYQKKIEVYEIKRNTSFEIGSSKYFIEEIGGYINLNNGYLEE